MDLMFRDTYIGKYEKDAIFIENRTSESLLYFGSVKSLFGSKVTEFISDRIISKDRRDINKFLSSINLSYYDPHLIALETRLVNPMDGFWLRDSLHETYDNFVIPKIEELFKYNRLGQKAAMSSGGQNIKYYTRHKGAFGVVKKRLLNMTYDTESELAVFYLSKLLGVDTCPVMRVDDDNTFSAFRYNFFSQSITHMRHALKEVDHSKELYPQIIKTYPQVKKDIIRMLVLDFITAQDDRHMSNYAMIEGALYPLYDNGRSLFWEDRVEDIKLYLTDVITYSKSFGTVGTYYDALVDISAQGTVFQQLVNLNISREQIQHCYVSAGYEGERLELLIEWTELCIKELISLDYRALI